MSSSPSPSPHPSFPSLSTLFPPSPPQNSNILSRLSSLLIRRTSSSYAPTTSLSLSITTNSVPPLLILPPQPLILSNLLTYLSALSHRHLQFISILSTTAISQNKRKSLNATIGCDCLHAVNTIILFLSEIDGKEEGEQGEVDRLRLGCLVVLELGIQHRSMAWSTTVISSSYDDDNHDNNVNVDGEWETETETQRRLKLLDLGVINLVLDETIDLIPGETLATIKKQLGFTLNPEDALNQFPRTIRNTIQHLTSHTTNLSSSTSSTNPTFYHNFLTTLSNNLSPSHTPSALLQGIQPDIDPEILFDWMRLKIGIERVGLGLGVVSWVMKSGKGVGRDAVMGLNGGDGLVMNEDDEEDEEIEVGEKEEIEEDVEPAVDTSHQVLQLVSQSPTFTATSVSNNNTTIDPAIDLIYVLELINALIERHEDSPHGATPDDMKVLVKKRPWIVRKTDEEETTDESEDDGDNDDETSEESSENSDTCKDEELDNTTNGEGNETITQQLGRTTNTTNIAPPQPILTSLFTLYDRYVEQQRAIWLDLPLPKIKCDRFTENGDVGVAWRKVVGKLSFGVLGTVTMLAHGMDEDQLYRWQQEEDDALRARKRIKRSKV